MLFVRSFVRASTLKTKRTQDLK